MSSSLESKLRTALAAIDTLPETSNRRIAAKQAWEAAPVNETLNEVFDSIQSGVAAAPYFESMGVYHELGSGKWTLIAYVSFRGERRTFEAVFDPADPQAAGEAVARAFIPTL